MGWQPLGGPDCCARAHGLWHPLLVGALDQERPSQQDCMGRDANV